jgi:hypothetical protein
MPVTKLVKLIEEKLNTIEKYVVFFALFSFIIHLALIFVNIQVGLNGQIQDYIGRNYLFAIATPLNIILFYEIFCLILALPKSIFVSVMLQMEVVALILVRQVFKIIAEAENISEAFQNQYFVVNLVLFFGGSILAFALTAVFRIITKELIKKDYKQGRIYIFKSTITFLFLIILGFLAIYELGLILPIVWGGVANGFDYISTVFFILIFVDVIVFLTALYYTDDFGIVFMDTAFILAGIFLRFAITFDGIYKVATILLSMLGIILIILVYKHLWQKLSY